MLSIWLWSRNKHGVFYRTQMPCGSNC
ncbi:hypothetical protein LINPERHAP2_LOCUS9816 [Linum perenne]